LGAYGYLPTDAHKLRTELGSRELVIVAASTIGHLEVPRHRRELEGKVTQTGKLLVACRSESVSTNTMAYIGILPANGLSVGRVGVDVTTEFASEVGH